MLRRGRVCFVRRVLPPLHRLNRSAIIVHLRSKFMMPNDARKTLAGMRIEFSDADFFKYLKAGDREVVELFLDSGLSPDVRDPDRNAAVVIATRSGQKDIARMLLARGASPEPLLNVPASRKDGWDKLTASSGVLNFISSLLIAAVGGYFTLSYNKTQGNRESAAKEQATKVGELDAFQKLLPFLTSDPEVQKAAALTAIQQLGHPEFAAGLAVVLRGKGSNQYLQTAASTANPAIKQPADEAFSAIATRKTVVTKRPSNSLSSPISTVFYVRDGTNSIGEFRRSDQGWKESFEDLAQPRQWTEVQSGQPDEILLTSYGAQIKIDVADGAIYYSDGKTDFRRLDTIVSVERR